MNAIDAIERTPDATVTIGNTQVELTIAGDISDQTKRGIDYLYDQGFDPDYDPAQSLLLPQSCAPKIGEHCLIDQEDSVCDFIGRVEKLLDQLRPCEVIAFDVTDRDKLIALERLMKERVNDLRMQAISFKVSNRMRQAMIAYSQQPKAF